jgi:hypothetical protein
MVRRKTVEASAPAYYCIPVHIIWPNSVSPKPLPLVDCDVFTTNKIRVKNTTRRPEITVHSYAREGSITFR